MSFCRQSAFLGVAATLGICPLLFAASTSSWTHTAEADFSGKMESVVASSLGELRLSRDTQKLIEQDARFDVVYAVKQLADASIVLGTGPSGLVMKYSNGKLTELFKPADAAMASAIALRPDGKLLVGLSGAAATLVSIDPATGVSKELFRSDSAQFVWAIHPLKDGSALLATGPTGQLLQVSPDGVVRVVVSTRQHNVLSILPLADDMVVIGTDPDGLVIRVNTVTGEWFVLYDAPEPEITAIVAGPDGSIYAAATSAVTAPGEKPSSAKTGRPEVTPDVPLRREPCAAPEPPKLPDPSPNEPEPIPKLPTSVMHMDIEEVESDDSTPAASRPSTLPSHVQPPAGTGEAETGSAIYQISAGGFVHEIFRQSAAINCMLLSQGNLIVGTGPEGFIFEVRPTTEEATVMAQSSSRQVSAMSLTSDGRVLMGLANPGGLLQMEAGHAASGAYTSEVLDATQVAQFGKLQLQGTLPAGTGATLATRSGNVQDPDTGGWSKWSDDSAAAEFMPIIAPPARFLQYRLTLSTNNASATPVVEEIKINYLLPNMPPKISSVLVEPEASEAQPQSYPPAHKITWNASDPNDDAMVYSLHYRLGTKGSWVLLKDGLKEASFSWNTRQVADGRYQVRVTASDVRANAVGDGRTGTRFSEPIIIDNAPPVIGDIKSQVQGDQLSVSLRVIDRTSIVAGVEYSVDSGDDWQAAAASDMLFDSPDEAVKFTVAKMPAGFHQVTIRARDSSGNSAYETLMVTVDKN